MRRPLTRGPRQGRQPCPAYPLNAAFRLPRTALRRPQTVSGRYFHNIKSSLPVPQERVHPAATAHVNGTLYHNASFANYLRQQRGYQTAIFGKVRGPQTADCAPLHTSGG